MTENCQIANEQNLHEILAMMNDAKHRLLRSLKHGDLFTPDYYRKSRNQVCLFLLVPETELPALHQLCCGNISRSPVIGIDTTERQFKIFDKYEGKFVFNEKPDKKSHEIHGEKYYIEKYLKNDISKIPDRETSSVIYLFVSSTYIPCMESSLKNGIRKPPDKIRPSCAELLSNLPCDYPGLRVCVVYNEVHATSASNFEAIKKQLSNENITLLQLTSSESHESDSRMTNYVRFCNVISAVVTGLRDRVVAYYRYLFRADAISG